MSWRLVALLSLLVTAAQPPAAQPAPRPDALDETLALVGLRRADLGWVPKSWWPRFPRVPYKLAAFDGLLAEPLDAVAYTRALGAAAWTQLDPERLARRADRNATTLFRAVQQLGVDPRFGGFRGYSVNLIAEPTPLDEAVVRLIEAAGRPTRIVSFGQELPYPQVRAELARQAAAFDPQVSKILGQLVLNIVDAQRWAELAFRKVDGRDRLVVATRYNVGEESVDAFDYCPQIDDVARTWDEASLWYAALKCVQALDDARLALGALEPEQLGQAGFDYRTPWGWIRIRGTGDDVVDGRDCLLIVDLGGDDRYHGPVAASAPDRPIGLLLDLAGDDQYLAEDQPAQGAGLAGIGVLLDAAGDDRYQAGHYAQGVGQFGLGLCADLGGDDQYSCTFSGQGCGYFGIGLLFDVDGDDSYKLWGDGQGFGGVAGVGVLADRTGDDSYTAVREHTVTGRPSYHSPDEDVAVSNAQGCAMGRRGDGSDGHSWAGGLGALLDGDGDDSYLAGNWSMGTGYWFGIGILHDRAGNDIYRGSVWSQASGAHFCVGVLVDEAGDDQHLVEATANNSLAFAHDFTVALLVDVGGNDLYDVRQHGLGYSINRSVAMLIDTGGDDTYRSEKTPRPGFARNAERFRARGGVSTYFADTTSLGLFLDVGGNDRYFNDTLKNDTHWLDPPDSPNWADRNFSVGVDRAAGTVDLTPRPVRPPSGPPPARTSGN